MSNNYAKLHELTRLSRDDGASVRCADRLLAMRKRLAPVRALKSDGSLLLATWNIRDFDAGKFGFGKRLGETFFYISEIISCFDLVAVQEVNRDLSGLERVMAILGREWDYIATDPTEGRGGNAERMAFVYNTEKVWFRRIAGEVVLPDGQLIVSRQKTSQQDAPSAGAVEEAVESGFQEVRQQFARTPFVVAFQSGWFKFNLCTVHIYFGDDSGDKLKRRIGEIETLVDFFADRQDKENKAADGDPSRMENYILLGDFNVVSPEHDTMKALKRRGFEIPKEIDGPAVRKIDEDHFYDQIVVRVKDDRFRVVTGGMVDLFADVFRNTAGDREIYKSALPKRDPEEGETGRATSSEALYKKWRTWQMSDHEPLWVQIETDFADDYLKGFAAPSG